MNYFKYTKIHQPRGVIWELFSSLAEVQEERVAALQDSANRGYVKCDYGHSLEIINSAMNGNIMKQFNLTSYEIKCERNDLISLEKERKVIDHIIEVGAEDRDVANNSIKYGQIASNDKRLQQVDSEVLFENIEEKLALEGYIDELFSCRKDCIRECGIDPIRALRDAYIDHVPSAISSIQEISIKKIRELIRKILIADREGFLRSIFENKEF